MDQKRLATHVRHARCSFHRIQWGSVTRLHPLISVPPWVARPLRPMHTAAKVRFRSSDLDFQPLRHTSMISDVH